MSLIDFTLQLQLVGQLSAALRHYPVKSNKHQSDNQGNQPINWHFTLADGSSARRRTKTNIDSLNDEGQCPEKGFGCSITALYSKIDQF